MTNRHQRRARKADLRGEQWSRFAPNLDYDSFISAMGTDTAKVLMCMLRSLVGEAVEEDRAIYESIRELIAKGFLDVHFRFAEDGVQIRHELKFPAPDRASIHVAGGQA